MSTLWKPKTDYKRLEDDWEDILEILPYVRLYDTLTQSELKELLRDAKRLHWQVLDLHRCGLDHLTEELGDLPDLRFLDAGNGIWGAKDIFREARKNTFSRIPDSIGNLANLKRLDVDNTQLTALPDSICNLANLQTLNVSNTQLTALPDSIGNLANLQSLDVSFTQLTALPDSIGNLANLQRLYVYKTQLTALPDSIGNLANLQKLDVYRTQLTALPDSIGNLANLKRLDVDNTRLTALPDSIGNLANLQTLYVDNTALTALPDSIGNLKSLKMLDLSWCHLSAIPYSLVQLGLPFRLDDTFGLDHICLWRVTLDEGDINLFSQPREVIEEYYRNRITETASECKVIFLGDGAAGKSSLIERMVHDAFAEGSLPTDGVKMTRWTAWPDKDKTPLTLDGKPLVLRLLDFGGQEIMHAMHRCFLTAHTVYVVVCESRNDTNIDSDARRWVETVRSFAPDCPVILALNKSDLNNRVTVNESTLKESNPAFVRSIRTSAKVDGDLGVKELVSCILDAVPGCLRQLTGNKGFLGLKQELETMTEDYILPGEFQERCDRFEIKKTLRTDLLNWFRDLGVAYPYAVTFREVYVLNPAWLTNGIYRLILRTDNGGFLRHSVIRDTLGNRYDNDVDPDKTYTPQEMEFILHVMRRFEISRPVTQGFEADGVEMIPLKMDKNTPEQVKAFPKADALHLRWEAKYLPNTLVHRLMIRRFEDLDTGCVWRMGGRFRSTGGGLSGGDGGCELLAELSEERALDVYAVGDGARGYMDGFRKQILRILEELNITAEEYVYCTVNGKKGRIPLAHVLALRKRGIGEIYLGDIDEFVSVDWILRENYEPPKRQENTETAARDFFISYNNKHDGERARWIADTLRSAGFTVFFQETDCTAGMSFPQWMGEAIGRSRGFVAVWSGAYEKAPFCQDELNAAYVKSRKESGYPLLLARVEDKPIQNALFKPFVRLDLLSCGDADREKLLDNVRSLASPLY